MKEKYSTLSLRIKDIKKNHIGEKEYQYSRNNYAGNPLIWAETTSPSTIAESRSSNDEIHTLLYVYQGDGAEYSLSPKGERLIFRKHPRKGALHTHEFVELMYVISGSFSQYISGELYTFKANTFVITDQNCKHADYISEKMLMSSSFK